MILSSQVSAEDIEMMFDFADADGDGKISWSEFQIMINPPKPPQPPKPTLLDLAMARWSLSVLSAVLEIKLRETSKEEKKICDN